MSPSTCVHCLKFFIEPSYCCLRAEGSWRPAPGKCARASIWVSIPSFQPGRRWEQAQLTNLSRAYMETKHTPGEAPKHSCVCDPQPAAGKCVLTFPQQNSLAQNREKRMMMPRARSGTGVGEFAAWGYWRCSYLCLWQTISPREHIVFSVSASSVSSRSSFFQGKTLKPHIPFPDSF